MFARIFLSLITFLTAAVLTNACGGSNSNTCGSNGDCIPGFEACFNGECLPIVVDAGIVDQGILPDTISNDPGSTNNDTTGIVDVPAPTDLTVDITPPTIVSVSPEAGSTTVNLDATITVKFSEAVKFGSFGALTFEVQDINGHKLNNPIGCLNNNDCASIPDTVCAKQYCVTAGHQTFTISADKTEVTFHPDPSETLLYASPYTVTMTTLIKDMANNSLTEGEKWTFYTRSHFGTENYAAMARKFAPQITQELKSEGYIYDIPTKIDLDGDWNASDNAGYLKATDTKQISPAVYWSLIESKSHYFITYQYYWTLGDSDVNKIKNIPNDSSGAMVIVAKSNMDSPELLVNYYSTSNTTAEMPAFAPMDTSFENISHTISSPYWFGLKGDSRPFETYVTSAFHNTCDIEFVPSSNLDPCFRTELDMTSMISVRLNAADTPSVFQKTGSDWVIPGQASYVLVPIMDTQWPRRLVDAESSQTLWEEGMSYSNLPTDRPGEGLMVPNAYIKPLANQPFQGRPAWAWKWKSALGNGEQTGLSRGMLFLDPAWFTAWRHIANQSESNVIDSWDTSTKDGFSLQYCFNPYLNIDLRGSDVDCSGI